MDYYTPIMNFIEAQYQRYNGKRKKLNIQLTILYAEADLNKYIQERHTASLIGVAKHPTEVLK